MGAENCQWQRIRRGDHDGCIFFLESSFINHSMQSMMGAVAQLPELSWLLRQLPTVPLKVRLADASPTDGAQDTAATPRKAAASVYDR